MTFTSHPGGHEIRSLDPAPVIPLRRAPKVVPIRGTALYRAAIREIEKLEAEVKRLTAENRALTWRLAAREDRDFDMRHDYTRGDLD